MIILKLIELLREKFLSIIINIVCGYKRYCRLYNMTIMQWEICVWHKLCNLIDVPMTYKYAAN